MTFWDIWRIEVLVVNRHKQSEIKVFTDLIRVVRKEVSVAETPNMSEIHFAE